MLALFSSPHRPFAAVVLLLLLAGPAAAQHWSDAFGAMGLDGDGLHDGEAYCLGEWSGRLAVGGWFEYAGDVATPHVALWNGETWEGLAGGVNQIPAFVEGSTHNLYVGGPFWEVDGEPWAYCARWDGSWHSMEGLAQPPLCGVFANGTTLWVGGSFTREETPPYWVGMKSWTGLEWADPTDFGSWDFYEDEGLAIGDGFETIHLGGRIMRIVGADTTRNHVAWHHEEGHQEYGRGLEHGVVECFAREDGFLWVGGSFTHADGQLSRGLVSVSSGGLYSPVNQSGVEREVVDMTMIGDRLYLAQSEGSNPRTWLVRSYNDGIWSDPYGGAFTDPLECIQSVGGDLYVGGFFDNGVVRWDGDEWVHLGGGIGRVHHDRHWFQALCVFDGDIVAGGEQIRLPAVLEGQLDCEGVVRWDGDGWHRLDQGLANDVTSLAVYQGALYAGQRYGTGQPRLQRWTGEAWEPVTTFDNQVLCLLVHGDELIVGGRFTTVGGTSANRVAAFDGQDWRALGAGFDDAVHALESYDGTLYAAGSFTTADGAPAARVARWTGSAWQALGDGLDDGHVYALSTYAGELYAGGAFTASGGAARQHVARWDGETWQALAEGVSGDVAYGVAALRGTTTGLYVGGDFTMAGQTPAGGLALWDGGWTAFGDGGVTESYNPRPTVSALLVHDGDLWVAGHFRRAGGDPSYCIAVWEDGSLVPNLLMAFAGEMLPRHGVRLNWRVAAELAGAEFRLRARAGESAWEVPWTSEGGAFTAEDRSPHLAVAAAVRYDLAYRTPDEPAWHDLGSTTVQLDTPAAIRLETAAPNPFNPRTRIAYELGRSGEAHVAVYDLAGRHLVTLASGFHAAGRHRVIWTGTDAGGRSLPAGAYVVRLETAHGLRTGKVMLVQ